MFDLGDKGPSPLDVGRDVLYCIVYYLSQRF